MCKGCELEGVSCDFYDENAINCYWWKSKENKKWHDLRKDPNDLPKCTENEQVIFYMQEYYKGIEKYINHYCLGFYKNLLWMMM